MVTTGLQIRLRAKPGREADVARFLRDIMPLIQDEAGTIVFLAVQLGPTDFGIVNAFEDGAGLQVHTTGHAANALFSRAQELLVEPPRIEGMTILDAKLPASTAVVV